jgi:hypothetical protein
VYTPNEALASAILEIESPAEVLIIRGREG